MGDTGPPIIRRKYWLPTLDNLRNFFLAPTLEMGNAVQQIQNIA